MPWHADTQPLKILTPGEMILQTHIKSLSQCTGGYINGTNHRMCLYEMSMYISLPHFT